MSILSYPRYVVLTGDTTTASALVEEMIPEAERMVETFLRRPLGIAERTELLYVELDGFVYPRAVPVLSVPATAVYEIYDDYALHCVSGEIGSFLTERVLNLDGYHVHLPRASVTYTGGWDATTAPYSIQRVLATLVYRMTNPRPVDDDTGGAQSKSIGDASVSYGTGGAPGFAEGRSALEAMCPGAERDLQFYRWTEDYS